MRSTTWFVSRSVWRACTPCRLTQLLRILSVFATTYIWWARCILRRVKLSNTSIPVNGLKPKRFVMPWDREEAARLALAAGAMQLGEGPRPHYILSGEQLVAFARAVCSCGRVDTDKVLSRALPPLPY